MASAYEAEQLAAVDAAAQQRDLVSLARLTRDATSAAVCEAGCAAFYNALVQDSRLTLVEVPHAVEALAFAMHAHPASADVHMHSCFVLTKLCMAEDGAGQDQAGEACALACACGAVEAVVAALRAHAEDGDVLRLALAALSQLSCYLAENCNRAHRAGALEAIVNAMRVHPTHESLQSNACLALLYICAAVQGAPNEAELLGAPALLVNALQSFPESSHVQTNALCFLAGVAAAEPSVDVAAVGWHAYAATCAVHALRAHAEHAGVQGAACGFLAKLTKDHAGFAADAWRQGAFPSIMTTLEVHTMRPEVLEPCLLAAGNILMGIQSAGLAVTLSSADAGVCSTVAALRAHPANWRVQSAGCALVSAVTFTAPQLSVAVAEAGTFEAMVHAMHALANSHISDLLIACSALGNLAVHGRAYRHRAHAAGAIDAVVSMMAAHPGISDVYQVAPCTLNRLCADDSPACAQAVQCGAVKLLCDAIRTHAGERESLKYSLYALTSLVYKTPSAADEVAAAGPAGIGLLVQLLLSSSPQHDGAILTSACALLAHIAARNAAAVSTADAVLPLLHVLNVCSHEKPLAAKSACRSLLFVMISSAAYRAYAAEHGVAAAVDIAALAHPGDADLQHSAACIRALLADLRAAAMADALIAEEEAERAAKQAAAARKRPKKKRGGGGSAAGAEVAAPAEEDAARAPERERAAAGATAALSALAVDDAAPSAAALRRHKRAAIKAARRLAQRAGASGGNEPAAAGEAESEDEADEGDAAADAAAEAAQPAALPPMSPPSSPPRAVAASAPPPAPLAQLPPPLIKECCVCLLDMPAAEQLVLVPCGHRCICDECWRGQLLPIQPAARLCPICDAPVLMAVQMFEA